MLANTPSKNTKHIERDFSNILKYKQKKSLRDLNVQNKIVLVRVDYNVPLDEEGKITDSRRIENTLPTLNYLLDQNCSIVLISHLGRPDGKVVVSLRMNPVYEKLKEFFPEINVLKADDCIGKEVEEKAKNLKPREMLLLENPRFYKEEEKNDLDFAEKLARLADVYVDDAFATAHRKQASTHGVCSFFEEKGYGFLVEKELTFLFLGESMKRYL